MKKFVKDCYFGENILNIIFDLILLLNLSLIFSVLLRI